MIPWSEVPAGHRRRDYDYSGKWVRCICRCGWASTLAVSTDDARKLWEVHVRKLRPGARS